MDDQKQIGMLVEQGRWIAREMAELKSDVKMLVAWRWKLYGVTAIIATLSAGAFELVIAFIERH